MNITKGDIEITKNVLDQVRTKIEEVNDLNSIVLGVSIKNIITYINKNKNVLITRSRE